MKKFELPAKTQAKLVKVTPHKEFDGKNPLKQAISLRLRARLSLALLRQFSEHAPDIFVRRRDDADQQTEVDGVPPVLLEHVAADLVLPIGFSDEFTGYTVTIDRAMGDIELYGCKVSKLKVDEPLPEGEFGTAEIEWSVGSDEKITPELIGLLCTMDGGDIWLGQKAPEKPAEEKAARKAAKKQAEQEQAGQQRLDGGTIDGSKGHPGVDAAAAAEAERQANASKADLDASGNNPFGSTGKVDASMTEGAGAGGAVSATDAFIAANRLGSDLSDPPADAPAPAAEPTKGRRTRATVGAPE